MDRVRRRASEHRRAPRAPEERRSPEANHGRVRRLDPRTVVARVLTLSALRRHWGVVVPLVAVLGLQGGFRVLGLAGVLLLIVLLSGVAAAIEWARTGYAVDGGRLVVERGLLSRSLTVVPIDRIRGVDVQASALQRLLGIAAVRVDAAATGGKAGRGGAGRGPGARTRGSCATCCCARPARPGRGRAGPGRPGAGPGGGGAGGGGAGAVGEPCGSRCGTSRARCWPGSGRAGCCTRRWSAATCWPRWPRSARRPSCWTRSSSRCRCGAGSTRSSGNGPSPALVVGTVLAVLVLAVAGALVTAAVANWGFTLTRRGGTLVGRARAAVPPAGVAGARPGPRLRAGRAAAAPAGRRRPADRAGHRARRQAGGDGAAGSRRGQLLPLGPAAVARAVAAPAVFPFDVPLRRHPAAARRRRLVRAVVPVAGGRGRGWPPPGSGPGVAARCVLAALGVPLGLDRYAGLGHALDPRAVSVRSGSLRRRQACWPAAAVVGWTVRQTLVPAAGRAGHGDGGDRRRQRRLRRDRRRPPRDAVALMTEVDPRRVGPLTTLGW